MYISVYIRVFRGLIVIVYYTAYYIVAGIAVFRRVLLVTTADEGGR